jgi:hypothetical protein
MKPRRYRSGAAAVAIMLAVACGGESSSQSTTGPSPSLNGPWVGTWTYVSAGLTITDPVTATTTPYVTQATTTWQSAGGATGSFVVTPGASISGTFSIQIGAAGFNCSGTGTLTGTASAAAIAFDVPSISGSICQWSTNNHFDLHR